MTVSNSKPQFQYLPQYQPNQLICGFGQIAIITGWTVRQSVAKHLDAQDYAVIGNLYSPTRGISPLLRNLLANPHVRYLVILQAIKEDKNAGGCQCLIDFFKNGFTQSKSDTERDCWLISSEVTGYIDIEIPSYVLEQLRQSLVYREAKSIAELIEIVKTLSHQTRLEPWGEPLFFDEVEPVPTVLPGPRYGHRIEGKTIAETWVKILHRIKTTGTIRPTQYGQWQELIDLMAIVTDEPQEFYFPEPNYLPINRQFLQDYISQVLQDSPYQEEDAVLSSHGKTSASVSVKYNYGQRLRSWFGRDQIEQVIDKLTQDLNSSKAVMSLWDVKDYDNTDSPPCLNHIWVRIVDNELSLTATFRSNDMFSAWIANAMGLRALQQHILERILQQSETSLKLGPLITISQSAHIYSDCWEHADRIIKTEYTKLCKQRNFDDASGSFLVSIKDNQILVEHITPGSGEVVNCYTGKSARQLYQQIASDCPSLQVEHAMYLGTELQKAEIALLNSQSFTYIQDKLLSEKQ